MSLKTNYTDDILAPSMHSRRHFNIVDSRGGEVLFENVIIQDVSDYLQVGNSINGETINEQNNAINELENAKNHLSALNDTLRLQLDSENAINILKKTDDSWGVIDSLARSSEFKRYAGLGHLNAVDLNTVTYSCNALALANCTNMPSVNEWITLVVLAGGSGSVLQIAVTCLSNSLYFRHFNGNTWSSWVKLS